MRLEVKTDNQIFLNRISSVLVLSGILFFAAVFVNISLKISTISKYYQINYRCKLLFVEKSSFNFKKLSRLTKLTNKQKIWDFCKEIQ